MQLWLDLDNTLVCAMPGFFVEHPPVGVLAREGGPPSPERPIYYLYPRPGLVELLAQVSALPGATVHLWTAGRRRYAERILDALGVRPLLGQVLGYEDCTLVEGKPHKDLGRLDAAEALFVDDRPRTVLARGVDVLSIGSFTGEPDDDRLVWLRRGLCGEAPSGWRARVSAPVERNWPRARSWAWVYDWSGEKWPAGAPFRDWKRPQ